MAFKARLKMAGKEFDILNCNYQLTRDVDHKGRPSSGVYGGTVNVTLESTDDTSIIESMVNSQFKPLDGSIIVKKSEEDATMKELKFEKGYIVQYAEAIDTVGNSPMSFNFTISARKLKIGNAEHENDWPDVK